MDDEIQQLLAEAEHRLRNDGPTPASPAPSPETALPNIPKLSSSSLKPYVQHHNEVAVVDTTRLLGSTVNTGILPLVRNRETAKVTSKKDKPTAGSDWFDLPKTDLTPELKRDLQLLRMRSILDPKRHYKKENAKAQLPKFSQVGTIIEGPTEFFSGRIAKRDRKKTFVEEALVLEKETKRFESRYHDVQGRKTSGKKAFYKSLRSKRNGGKNQR
ncbi:Fcf2 pre-rRNA processing-domain-containing protein [Aspergillus karnatakaensis]|uniref:Fcf2 domain-containing protein n=1 Tax=Aspergillus karnatakaensis TaxID=1810916 RepID=UPI003CCD7A59